MDNYDCLKNLDNCKEGCSRIFYFIYEKINIKINEIINNFNESNKYQVIPLKENKKKENNNYNLNEWDIV